MCSLRDFANRRRWACERWIRWGLRRKIHGYHISLLNLKQYVSKINKLNFDLKLEIFHRTQQMATLEKKLKRMKEMEEELQRMQKLQEEVEDLRSANEDNRTLRESNEQLRQELDKRDQAVNEAVQLICQLEAKIDELEAGGRSSQSSMSRLAPDGPNATTPKVQQAVEIPERTSSREKTWRPQPSQPKSPELRQLAKAPSFLRADNQSTATLRSLYAPENSKSHTTLSELTKSESMNTMNEIEPESPRLSVLSEASELNPFDTPSRWNEFDKLDIPVRKTSSTSSLDSYVPPVKREESKSEEVDQWLQSHDTSGTIIRRRQNRALSQDSKTEVPAFNSELFSAKARGRPRIDTSIFEGARLPPTPDTMSTAYAAVNNGSNGSIAHSKSPKTAHDQWFASRRLDRHRSADEITTRRSLDGSDITDSMQTNCSDTPRLGVKNAESPTIFPFNTVAPKASKLLGPGSPNNPAINSFSDLREGSVDEAAPPTVKRYRTPAKATASGTGSTKLNSSPPLTPQDWVAAAARTPRSREEQRGEPRIEQQEQVPNRNITSQGPFHDNESMDSISISTEPDGPGIPTLDMHTLDLLEHPAIEPLATIPEPGQAEPESESSRRFSLRPSFLTRSTGPRRLQSSPMAPDYIDSEDDGAPSPIIPKHRNTDNARPRPMSQIITDSADLHQPTCDTAERNAAPRTLAQSFTEAREASLPAQTHSGSATISTRPSTSHSMDNKRRSSLGIFSWMRNVNGKRSEPVTPVVAETFADAAWRNEQRSRLAKERPAMGYEVPRPTTPESMVPSRAEMLMSISMHRPDETARRPRYMGRRSRRG